MESRVCILMPDVGVYPALGVMLENVFSEMGWRATVRHQANAELLSHDLLLLVGFCRHMDGLSDILRQRRGKRPVTVLWHLEPLPPPRLSPLGEEVGLRVAGWDWGRLPAPLRKTLDCIVPFRRQLLRLIQRRLARPYSREVIRQPDHDGWKNYNVENYCNASADWRWIKLAHANGWLDHCFTSVQPRVEFLRSRGVDARLLPVGYHPGWGRDLGLERDIDVLFLGSRTRGRRDPVLERLEADLAARGRTLTFARKVYGTERARLLSRARIYLSLLRLPHDMPGMRMLLGMAAGALVVSEHCDDTGPYVPGEHFVMRRTEELPEVIDYYLAHEDQRRKIASEGHRFVTEELTLASGMRTMLQTVSRNGSQ